MPLALILQLHITEQSGPVILVILCHSHWQWYLLRKPLCVCLCVFFPFILDIKFVGHTSRGHTGGRSHMIFHPPSFCGACLNFSREKDSAIIPLPRWPWSRILCTNDLIILHSLGIYFIYLFIFSEKNPVYRDRTHVSTFQKVTRFYLWATGATK